MNSTHPSLQSVLRATVMGLGRFGGGLGAAQWLAAHGVRVTVTDMKPEADLAEGVAELAPLIGAGRVTLRLGGHDVRDFVDTDLVVANPAVPRPWANRYLLAAQHAGVPIDTEIGLLLAQLDARTPVVGVTGSVGKSTTSSMIAHALCCCGVPALLGGNIGGSLLARLPLPADHALVLELSSAMLHWLGQGARPFAPRVAVWTNLSPNHLDWHGTLEHYGACKAALLRHQGPGDSAVLGPGLLAHAPGARAQISEVAGPLDVRLRVPGAHNRLNAHFALRACLALAPHLSREAVLHALESFPGLDHRLCLVHTARDGRRFYNDSKCTTVSACLQAVEALREDGCTPSSIHLIVGGDAKGQDLSALGPLGAQLGGLYCIGRDGPQVARLATSARVHRTLREAVADALARTTGDDILLLSPACASWDQYPNYEHRGREFAQLVRAGAP